MVHTRDDKLSKFQVDVVKFVLEEIASVAPLVSKCLLGRLLVVPDVFPGFRGVRGVAEGYQRPHNLSIGVSAFELLLGAGYCY